MEFLCQQLVFPLNGWFSGCRILWTLRRRFHVQINIRRWVHQQLHGLRTRCSTCWATNVSEVWIRRAITFTVNRFRLTRWLIFKWQFWCDSFGTRFRIWWFGVVYIRNAQYVFGSTGRNAYLRWWIDCGFRFFRKWLRPTFTTIFCNNIKWDIMPAISIVINRGFLIILEEWKKGKRKQIAVNRT